MSSRQGHEYIYQKQTWRPAGNKRELSPGSHDPAFTSSLFPVLTRLPVSPSVLVPWLAPVPSRLAFLLHHKFAPVAERNSAFVANAIRR